MRQTSFFIIYKYYLKIYKIPIIEPDNPYIVIKVEHFKFLYNKFKDKLLFIKDRIIKYYNIKRIKRLSFKKKAKCIYSVKTLLSNNQTTN